jgi:hypothetical protein
MAIIRLLQQQAAVLVSTLDLKTALFWVITQRVLVTPYRRLGTDKLFQKVCKKLPLLAA